MPIGESLGTATLELRTDQKNFDRGLKNAEKTLNQFGKRLTKIGRNLTLGVTTPIAIGFGKVVKLASGLQESMNAVNVVFEDSAKIITDFSKKAVTAAGVTQEEWNQAATILGAQLQQAGLEMDEVADKTNVLIQRAADMASIFNTDVNDALGAIQAALRGEIDPIERFGVAMNMASVEARALEEGIIDAGEEMSAGQAIAARFAEVMAQTDKYAGDFARTSNQLANRGRILRARFKQLGAEMGEQLLPIMEKIVTWLDKLVTAFGALSDDEKKNVMIFAGIAAAAGPAIMAIGSLIRAFGVMGKAFVFVGKTLSTAGPWVALATAVATVAFIIIKNWDKIREGTARLKERTTSMWESMKEAIVNWAKVIAFNTAAFFVDKWDKIMSATKQLWRYLREAFKSIADATVKMGKNLAETLNPKNWGKFIRGEASVKDVWKGTFDAMQEIGEQSVISFEEGLSDRAQGLADKAMEALKPALEATGETVQKQIENWQVSLGSVEDWAVKLKDKFKDFFGKGGDAFEGIQEFINQIKKLEGSLNQVAGAANRASAAMRTGAGAGFGGGAHREPREYGRSPGMFTSKGQHQQAQWAEFRNRILAPLGEAFQNVGRGAQRIWQGFTSVWGILQKLLSQFDTFNQFTEVLIETFVVAFQPAVDALVKALQPLIPIIDIIATIAAAILVPVLDVLGEAFRLVANLFIRIANVFIDIAQFFGSEVENIDLIERDESFMDESGAGTEGDTSSGGEYTTTGGGTSKPQIVQVRINIYDNEIAGSDGFTELAQIIRKQIERLETVNG